MSPLEPRLPETAESVSAAPVAVPRRAYRWYHKMSAVLFITFCIEVGCFLLIFPWTDFWDTNFFSSFIPEWHRYWENMYVRGAISGLGVIDLYISLLEILRLRRFARH
jgi:hypothetical protein